MNTGIALIIWLCGGIFIALAIGTTSPGAAFLFLVSYALLGVYLVGKHDKQLATTQSIDTPSTDVTE